MDHQISKLTELAFLRIERAGTCLMTYTTPGRKSVLDYQRKLIIKMLLLNPKPSYQQILAEVNKKLDRPIRSTASLSRFIRARGLEDFQ